MGTDPKPPVLEARDMVCTIGEGAARVQAVRGVNLSLQEGELVAISGPSGCGKSSLLYALGLLDQLASGEIVLGGQPTANMSETKRTHLRNAAIGFVFQFHYLLSEFSALENVLLPMRKHARLSPREQTDRAHYLLEQVDMSDKSRRPGNQLSGGERQRVALARALANQPKVVLADEPTGNLDQENSERVFQMLQNITQTQGSAVVLVTHNPKLATQANRTLNMRDGLLV